MDDNFLNFIKELGMLIVALKQLDTMTKARKKQLSEALDALHKAAHSTHGYYAAQKAGKGIDKEKEHQLAHLWMTVADKVRDYDEDLARRFRLKRHYWLSPETWTNDEVKAAKIGLDDITKETEVLRDSKR